MIYTSNLLLKSYYILLTALRGGSSEGKGGAAVNFDP